MCARNPRKYKVCRARRSETAAFERESAECGQGFPSLVHVLFCAVCLPRRGGSICAVRLFLKRLCQWPESLVNAKVLFSRQILSRVLPCDDSEITVLIITRGKIFSTGGEAFSIHVAQSFCFFKMAMDKKNRGQYNQLTSCEQQLVSDCFIFIGRFKFI